MNNQIPNSYLLPDSQYLKKEEKHECLIASILFDGYLIPFSHKHVLEQYQQRFPPHEVYDPIVDECKEVQQLALRKKIIQNKQKFIIIDIEKYAREKKKVLKNLIDEMDVYICSKMQENEDFKDELKQIDRDIIYYKSKKVSSSSDVNFTSIPLGKLRKFPPKQWLVEEIFGPGDLGVIYGPSGCGKTFVVIDFILKICAGRRWAHRFNVTRPITTAYCAGEGIGALPSRFDTAAAYHGLKDLSNFHFFNMVPQLYEDTSPVFVLKFIADWKAQQDTGDVKSLDLLVIDTFHTAIIGADENSSQHLGKIIQSCQMIRNALGCAILLIHHTNKSGNDERGSSALRGACDIIIKISKTGEGGTTATMECSKSKDGEMWSPQNFNLSPLEGYESVHVAWDIVGGSSSFDDTKEGITQKILELFDYHQGEKLMCSAIAKALSKEEKFINRILTSLVDKGIIERELMNSSKVSKKNPWIYSKKP